jgi:alpha-tubulin suppressor-like RCC1 family protein
VQCDAGYVNCQAGCCVASVSPILKQSRLSAGAFHTCGITATGGVKCWGANIQGQLGNGSTTESLVPMASRLTSDVVALAVGTIHSCALTGNGGVKCWGGNTQGQLGTNSLIKVPVPADVVGLTSGVTAIAAGNYHTCAITSLGGVECWGSNSDGQLGDGSTLRRLTPKAVIGIASGAISIAAGGNHTCALLSGGGVKCWGLNSLGQLGNGTTVSSATPVTTNLGSVAISLAAGEHHSCVVTASGGVQCWGFNSHGQLGDELTLDSSSPVVVKNLDSTILAVSAGERHTCVIGTGGRIQCWGANLQGQLGNNTLVSNFQPVELTSWKAGASDLSAGRNHNCGFAGAALACWGLNNAGQLGIGSKVDALLSESVSF